MRPIRLFRRHVLVTFLTLSIQLEDIFLLQDLLCDVLSTVSKLLELEWWTRRALSLTKSINQISTSFLKFYFF